MEFLLDFERPIKEIEVRIKELKKISKGGEEKDNREIDLLKKKLLKIKGNIYENLTPAQILKIARHPNRPTSLDYINYLITDFIEIHGDRAVGEDNAIITGIGYLEKQKLGIIAQQKGKSTEENLKRNFGMAHPQGYRKTRRLMDLCERFNIPMIMFIDTPGAYPGIEAEELGQGWAIAENLLKLADLKTRIINVILSEGGSGGALALGIGDCIMMLKYAVYSVISPEGCASILYRDAAKATEAAQALKITSLDLKKFNIIDEIIEEGREGAHRNFEITAQNLKNAIIKNLEKLLKEKDIEKIINKRKQRFYNIGKFHKGGK